MSENPFEYGRELGLDELVDRQDELNAIEAAIRNRAKLFLIGPRRFGKTSLLSAADEAASRRGTIVLRLDAEKYESLELFASAILTTALRALQGPLERSIELLRKVASRLKPEATFEEGGVTVRLGVSPDESGELPLLTEALDAVERLARETERSVVVILDEVQQVVVEHGIAAERQLRSTIQTHRHVGYIFAGSATRLLTEMTSDPNRPFYRLGSRLFLGRLPREDFLAFLVRGFQESGFDVTDGSCERILERAEEVPYNVQRLAHEAWEAVRAGGHRTLTLEIVDAALRQIVLREDPAYTQIWTTLTANQKKTLKAVIASRGEQLFTADVARRFRIPTSSLQAALRSLEKAHLVRAEQDRGQVRYRLVDPFVAAWLAESQAA
jgi:AAA+ ATPase superfamily predicted ATPase